MLRFDFNNMTVGAIGSKQGIDIDKAIVQDKQTIQSAYDEVIGNIGKGWQEWCLLPETSNDQIDELVAYTAGIAKVASDFVVFGIGGSALGPLSVATALMHQKHNSLSSDKRRTPRLFVEDNIDPIRMSSLLDVIDIDKAYFNVITKSGETSETLAQFIIIYNMLISRLGKDEAKKRIIVTTTIGKGALYDTAIKEGFKIYGVGQGVGGRFSVLSAVGLVTFGVMGLDIKAMLAGAKTASERAKNKDIMQNPALLSAFLQVQSMQKGANISVLMPYSDALKYMSDFYCQLWGESLGKSLDKSGKLVNVGQTPVKSIGVTDQHSQVQLYTEGPYDKVVTFIAVEDFGTDLVIPAMDMTAGKFLANCTMGKLLDAERVATEFALTKASRASFVITLPKVAEASVGELVMYFMYETAFAGALLGIDTFNQPGVEEGKKATFAMIGREGYGDKLAEIKSKTRDKKYML